MKTIVIIDDDAILLKNLADFFESKSYEVKGFDNARDGLAAIYAARPDAILLDLMMPDLNGIEAIKDMHAKDPSLLKEVIVTTNASDIEYLSVALELGVKSYLMKSEMSLEKILEAVEGKAA